MKNSFNNVLDHRLNGSYRWKQPEGRNDILGMDTADMDFSCPACLQSRTRNVWQENTFNYRGIPDAYFEAICSWYQRKYNFTAQREWLSNVPGTIAAIRIALELFGKQDGVVLMQEPYFSPLKRAIEGAGCVLRTNPMILKDGRFEIDFEDFEEKIKTLHPVIFLLVNPHNPTGRVFGRDDLEKMIAICYEYNVTVISDEVHSLITYDENQHIPVLNISELARKIAIQVISVSKGFNMMGLPHAIVMIADEEKKVRWDHCMESYSFSYAYNAYCIAGVTAVLSGEADEWLAEVTEYLQLNKRLLVDACMQSDLPIVPYPPEAGFLLWADCSKTGISPELLDKAFFEQAGIRLNNGLDHGEGGRGFVRINFALTLDNIACAIKRIQRMFNK